ncbi:hypothetical protein FLP41_02740 (plasmid) [Paracoccus marcusii]|uniref:AMP-binding enzyme n=1 Tax=Paracoccus marcusii TaxID=59779 RepID=UPI002ED14C8F|nr:hypothetical protein FLP41_02740 [Paracoccus marcusii]
MARLPGVRDVAVVAKGQGPGDRQLIGYATGEGLDGAALRAALSRELPDFMVPLQIHVLPEMPLTPTARSTARRWRRPMPRRPRPGSHRRHHRPLRLPRRSPPRRPRSTTCNRGSARSRPASWACRGSRG